MPNPAKQVLNDHLGEVPDEPGAQKTPSIWVSKSWAARDAANPMATLSPVVRSLLRASDALEAACFFWEEGITQRRPGTGHLPTEIVRQAMVVVAREVPELLSAAGEILLAANVPIDLIEEIEREVAA
jgi:hypothetical protein